VTSLYGLLGVPRDASADEIRRAYYRAARQLHPDVNPRDDADATMRRLNHAWAVLGDPVARRRYDAELSPSPLSQPSQRSQPAPPAPPSPAQYRPAEPPEPAPPHPPLFLRPSALIVAVLVLIFVVTAYAGHVGSRNTPTSPGPSSSVAPAQTPAVTGVPTGTDSLLGECLEPEPGYDAVVPCGQPNLGQVVMLVAASSQCPADTSAYQLKGQPQWVCLRSSTSG
jgi:hypothetical protein